MSSSKDRFHLSSHNSSQLAAPKVKQVEEVSHPPPLSTPLLDDGQPTHDVYTDLLRVLELIHSERHLIALTLFQSVEERFKDFQFQEEDGEHPRNDTSTFTQQDLDLKKNNGTIMVKSSSRNDHSSNSSTSKLVLHPVITFSLHKKNNLQSQITKTMTQEWDPLIHEKDKLIQQKRSAWKLLQEKKEEFEVLKKRCILFERAKMDQKNQGWIFSQTIFGISTFYRREQDDTLTIKLEGDINDVPLFEQLAILREVSLFRYWAPFCCDSRNIAQLGNIDMIGYLNCGSTTFGLSRDVCFRVIGCDSLREEGKIILVAEGIGNDKDEQGHHDDDKNTSYDMSFLSSDPNINNIDLPPIPTKFGAGRMTLRRFEAMIDVLSPTSARTRIISSVDPNLNFIPHVLLDFIMRKMCGVLLYHLQSAATKLSLRPDSTPYAERIRTDPFYKLWLVPKFKTYCQYMGWKIPLIQIFDSLSLTDGEMLSPTTDTSSLRVLSSDDSQMTSRTGFSHDEHQRALNSLQGSIASSNLFIKRRIRKDLERAHSRELILNSLRPTPFREEQLSRLKILRDVKDKVSMSSSIDVNGTHNNLMNRNMWELILYPSQWETILTGETSQLPHKSVIAIFLLTMFIIFFATYDEERVIFDVSMDLQFLYLPLRLLQLFSFSVIYYLLMNRTIVTIFDTIELPGTLNISNDKALASSRRLFIRYSRIFCLYLIGCILFISFVHGIVDYILFKMEHKSIWDPSTTRDSMAVDSIVVEDTKWFMSYSAVFIIFLLGIANYVAPNRKLKMI